MNENKYKILTSLDKGRCPKGGGVCKKEIKNIFDFTNTNCNV
jgi:hypothetical protein